MRLLIHTNAQQDLVTARIRKSAQHLASLISNGTVTLELIDGLTNDEVDQWNNSRWSASYTESLAKIDLTFTDYIDLVSKLGVTEGQKSFRQVIRGGDDTDIVTSSSSVVSKYLSSSNPSAVQLRATDFLKQNLDIKGAVPTESVKLSVPLRMSLIF